MRYLVTGGCGFIGSHYVRHLVQQGHEVVVVDRLDHAGAADRLAMMTRLEVTPIEGGFDLKIANGAVKFVRHDLAAGINAHVDRAIGDVDIVCHMAAASHVDRSVVDPWCYLQDNVVATFQLLQWVRTRPIKRFFHMSTDEVFGPAPDGVTFREHDAHNPNNPYAATKAAAEMLCPAWASTFDVPIVVVHCTNVIGSGQDPEKFVPLVAQRVMNGEMVQIHADPQTMAPSTRLYIHVSDVCDAFDTIIAKGGILGGNGAGRYNISGDVEWSNLEVAKTVADLLGKDLRYELVSFVPNRPKHDQRYSVSWKKLKALGWSPRVGLLDGLREALGVPLSPEASQLVFPEPSRVGSF
ncbi:MAG TPA: GDP-mannose 4,6-dehydratase [Actinomycetes bacterium]|nr:GDP-mannose 4,6-dehydratase [Actinomycetes bacterium]